MKRNQRTGHTVPITFLTCFDTFALTFVFLYHVMSLSSLKVGATYPIPSEVDFSLKRGLGRAIFGHATAEDTKTTGNVWVFRSTTKNYNVAKQLSTITLRFRCPHSIEQKPHLVDGSRPNQNSMFTECEVQGTASVSLKTMTTRVNSISGKHNHQVGPEYARFYASERQLSKEEKLEIARLLDLKAAPQLIANELSQRNDKLITSRQITNARPVSSYLS